MQSNNTVFCKYRKSKEIGGLSIDLFQATLLSSGTTTPKSGCRRSVLCQDWSTKETARTADEIPNITSSIQQQQQTN